ncbi:MAG: branched-chain amino acid ABC transporter substrate-binding protein [Anaerolineae bacterium CFX3]|nr:branched-chain amino acid ABC transporter substrate-binding protein [Anaerolineae bacterium]MCE7905675.1 branched-chain amino acid ABC transporter substrate-binding protein [Anaerolineae bacterium CFX3]MCQ3947117.1 branched-chain amino acid ABC transporter substrate-binding protein [Anaerolineae bacterium]RIK26187.1 MAG: branched-chain amino acid ABC transporter substrate-binding protein [Anaerolineae bacterium]
MNKRLFVLLSVLVVASLALSACGGGGGGGGAAVKTIKIATQSPLSGDNSAVGVDIKRGAELALEQMGGGLTAMGFKVELAPFDDQANPDTGVANAKQIVSDPDILCVVGHYNSGVQIPSSEVYHTAGLANVSPANTNPKVTTRGYLEVSRIVGRDDVQGVVGADYAASQGKKSAFVVHDKTAYGQGIAEFFKQEAEAKGMEVLGFEGTEEKANFDALLSPILAANPDVVYFGGMYGQAALLFKQAREKGYMGMFMSDDGFDSSDAAKIGGQSLLEGAGTFYSTVSGPAAVYPDTAKFIADFKAKYNADPQPFAAQSYDSMGICLKAIEAAAKAGNGKLPTRAEVAQAVRGLAEYKGITGTVTFNSIGDPVIAKYFVIQVGSADPAKWPENPIVQTLDIAPPAP